MLMLGGKVSHSWLSDDLICETGLQTYVSPMVDKARLKSQGGNNSPGPIYRQGVSYELPDATLLKSQEPPG